MMHSPTPRRRTRTRTATEWQHPATRRGYLLPHEVAGLLRLSDHAFAALCDREWDSAGGPTFTLHADR